VEPGSWGDPGQRLDPSGVYKRGASLPTAPGPEHAGVDPHFHTELETAHLPIRKPLVEDVGSGWSFDVHHELLRATVKTRSLNRVPRIRTSAIDRQTRKLDMQTRRTVLASANRVECSAPMPSAEFLLTQRFAAPSISRRRRRRRRGRPAIKVPVRLPRRPHWDDEQQVSFYVTELALISGGIGMLKAIEHMDPHDALMHMAHTLLRRHRDQVLRAHRAPREDAARLLWKASRLLPLAGRLASDAGRASGQC